jgi:uncharacterized protein YndB with AHSA1/START domain
MSVPDKIEKQITLRAPLARVWSALSNAREFGAWFGAEFDGPFVAGQRVKGKIRPTSVDPEVAKLQAPHDGAPFEITVERIEPERLFSFRWRPGIEPIAVDGQELTTLVVFELREVDGGTLLRITESGFDRIPLAQRAKAFTENEGGWQHQTELIAKYLLRHAA